MFNCHLMLLIHFVYRTTLTTISFFAFPKLNHLLQQENFVFDWYSHVKAKLYCVGHQEISPNTSLNFYIPTQNTDMYISYYVPQ